jgi:hypothetical protein
MFHKFFILSYQLFPNIININTKSIQSIPILGLFSASYLALAYDTAVIGFKPQLSAKQVGIPSNASANDLTAYYSTDEI